MTGTVEAVFYQFADILYKSPEWVIADFDGYGYDSTPMLPVISTTWSTIMGQLPTNEWYKAWGYDAGTGSYRSPFTNVSSPIDHITGSPGLLAFMQNNAWVRIDGMLLQYTEISGMEFIGTSPAHYPNQPDSSITHVLADRYKVFQTVKYIR